jgi:hypothetical protein
MAQLNLILFILLVLSLGIVLGWLLARLLRRANTPQTPVPPTPPAEPPPSTKPPHRIPDDFGEHDLPVALSTRLTGSPANGVSSGASDAPPRAVVWVDGGNEVLVHLDSTLVRILDGLLLVSVDLETDQTGRTPLVCAFALGNGGDMAGLIATTDEFPRGNGLLASSWGKTLQNAVWSSLLALAADHATERSGAPRAISVTAGKLTLQAGAALQLTARVRPG